MTSYELIGGPADGVKGTFPGIPPFVFKWREGELLFTLSDNVAGDVYTYLSPGRYVYAPEEESYRQAKKKAGLS